MNGLSGSASAVIVLVAVVGLLAGLFGLALYVAERRRAAAQQPTGARRRLPQQWPLNPRPLANSAERRVWSWLHQTFPQHHVLPKVPLTRFTMPREGAHGSEWFELLSGAYCSFTLCDERAHVIGCVDILGPRGLSRGNRQLKQTLLAQCGIGYWVLAAESLPEPAAIRAEFLGALANDSVPPVSEQARMESVRHQLHEALDRNRSQRYRRAMNDGDSAAQGPDSEITPWPQADSFLGSFDSRRGELRER